MRYLNSEGWSSNSGEVTPNCAGGPFLVNLSLTPVTSGAYPSPASNFVSGDLAMISSSSGDTAIFQANVAGTTLTPTNLLHTGDQVACPGSGEVRLYNFSRNFITVTYWLRLDADPATAGRFIPALMRTQADNTGTPGATATRTDVELVQGIEQLNFLFGLQKSDGTTQYLKASDISGNSSATTCPSPPAQYVQNIFGVYEPDCLWRSVKSIESHLLANSVNDSDLAGDEMAYQYNGSGTPAAPPATMPSGLPSGRMMRREFVSLTSVRNFNN
jgi:type IV pilus assembly protein PilW